MHVAGNFLTPLNLVSISKPSIVNDLIINIPKKITPDLLMSYDTWFDWREFLSLLLDKRHGLSLRTEEQPKARLIGNISNRTYDINRMKAAN